MRRALVPLVLALATGCGPVDFADVQVSQARLVSLSTLDVTVFGGLGGGDGRISLVDVDGNAFSGKVHVNVGTVGSMLELAIESFDGAQFDLGAAGTVTASDLLGGYEGSHDSAALLVGLCGYDLENDRHVRLEGGGGLAGFSLYAGHLWAEIEPAGDLEPAP